MATDDTTRYSDLCRLCASKTNVVLGINIFEGNEQINKKIDTCLPIQVLESDHLPKMICQSCFYKLELFFEFRERSLRTETLLIDLLKELSSQKLHNQPQIIKLTQPLDIPMDNHDFIMVPNNSVLSDETINEVPEMDLHHLHQGDIIVQQEIILNHQNVDLNNIDLNHHKFGSQDLSNHSLTSQETAILGENSNGVQLIQHSQYTEGNLELISEDHRILTEQFRLRADLHITMTETDDTVDNITISTSPTSELEHVNEIQQVVQDSTRLDPSEVLQRHQSQRHLHIGSREANNIKEEPSPVIMPAEVPHYNASILESKLEDCNSNGVLINGEDKEHLKIQSYLAPSILSESNNLINSSCNSQSNFFYCNMCGKSFIEKLEFQIHYELHFNKCLSCLAVFTNRDALNAHRKEVHGSRVDEIKPTKTRHKRATVDIKKEEYNSDTDGGNDPDNSLEQIEEEEEEFDPELDIPDPINPKRKKILPKVCIECGKSYKTNYKLMEHMRKHTGERPFKCKTCDRSFRSKIGLAQHEAKHTGQYELSCPTCGKGFQCKSYLMVHQRVHSDIKPYPCTTCGRNFKTKQSLLDHTNRHLGVKPYMCDTCGRGFITKGLCKAHQKIHTGLDNRKYSCKICAKMFVSKSYLQTHLRIHTGEKPFMCEVCGKGFLTRVDLRIHSTMHTGEKSYVCEICGKAFARRDALRCHRRSHTGERPYSCDQCGQTFTQFSPMAIHKRLHTGERPYSCEVCGKAFVSRSTMMAHFKKHVQ